MPFGLTNAPSTFQATMNDIFHPHLRKFILVFFDDILIYSPSLDEHLDHLRTTLHILDQHKLFANLNKCSFGLTELEYLGHIIFAKGVRVDPNKIDAMINWPIPNSITAVRGFLGLTGYYRRFIQNYAAISSPLSDLLKHNNFVWGPQAQKAFEHLKTAVTQTPILILPNFSQIFTVTTDASAIAIGAVLAQSDRPIAFFSLKLPRHLHKSSAYSREMFAITSSIKKWRHYLLGRPFQIYTDHQSILVQ